MASCMYLLLTLAIMQGYSVAASTMEKKSDNTQSIAQASFYDYCNALCQVAACPPQCMQAPIGPWSRKRAAITRKRAFDQTAFNGLTFDDYGWFMKLLGRDVDKRNS
ncbi:hypothetical protein KP79_PYT03671 [Mizuhopecten yessoensis]|uniref:Uncharacterized protein n=1 Tax=Mizuhopecten yessoensis TaxID=6573 RepID=A0A210R576_MIZYE|nr:hypothetical protein KP79_PYT03671 [Mizuhopecten yessoensis]